MTLAWLNIMAAVGQPTWEVVTVADRASAALESRWYIAVAYMILALVAIAAMVVALGMGLIYAERKIAAHFQCRLGPMRVGYARDPADRGRHDQAAAQGRCRSRHRPTRSCTCWRRSCRWWRRC